jgi:hypothetical protein
MVILGIGCKNIGFEWFEGDDDTTAGGIFDHFLGHLHQVSLKQVGCRTVKIITELSGLQQIREAPARNKVNILNQM